MKKIIFLQLICFILFMTGCSTNKSESQTDTTESESVTEPAENDTILPSSALDEDDTKASDTVPGHYVFVFSDSDGNPVEGVRLTICDDETCQMQVSDVSGTVDITLEPKQYSAHIMGVPEGYDNPYTDEIILSESGDRLSFVLTR